MCMALVSLLPRSLVDFFLVQKHNKKHILLQNISAELCSLCVEQCVLNIRKKCVFKN